MILGKQNKMDKMKKKKKKQNRGMRIVGEKKGKNKERSVEDVS